MNKSALCQCIFGLFTFITRLIVVSISKMAFLGKTPFFHSVNNLYYSFSQTVDYSTVCGEWIIYPKRITDNYR